MLEFEYIWLNSMQSTTAHDCHAIRTLVDYHIVKFGWNITLIQQ